MGLAVTYLDIPVTTHNLNRALYSRINTISKGKTGNVGCDGDDSYSDYDSDTCLDNFNISKSKRRKLSN